LARLFDFARNGNDVPSRVNIFDAMFGAVGDQPGPGPERPPAKIELL